jgi:hypothetical protein
MGGPSGFFFCQAPGGVAAKRSIVHPFSSPTLNRALFKVHVSRASLIEKTTLSFLTSNGETAHVSADPAVLGAMVGSVGQYAPNFA